MSASDLNISMILKLVDQVTKPARQVMGVLDEIGAKTETVGRRGVAWSNEQIAANQARMGALQSEAFGVAAVAGSIAAALKPAIDFEKAMDGVGAVARADDEELARLTATARELGATTNWSASDAAEGMKFLAMAGFDANQTIAAMPGLLSLASAGATDLGTTSDIASDILSGFQMEASEMARLGDILANTFTSSNTNLTMLGDTMKYVAPNAEALGVSVEMTAAMTGKLADAGIKGSQAGTALRAMLIRLSALPKPTADAMKELGVATTDADGNLREISAVLADVQNALDGHGSAKQAKLISDIFGMEAASASTILLAKAASGELDEYAATLAETGSAARIAAGMNDNTAGALKRLQSITESLSISVGTILLPQIVNLIETVIPMVDAAQKWAEAHPELIAMIFKLTGVLLGLKLASIATRFALFAMLGPILQIVRGASWMIVGMAKLGRGLLALINPMKVVRGAFVALRVAFLATGIGALVAGLAAAGVWVYNNWSGLKSFFVGFGQGFMEALGPAKPLAEGIVSAVRKIWDWLGKILGPLDANMEQWNGWGQAVGRAVGNVIKAIITLPGRIAEGLKAAWTAVTDWINLMWTDLPKAAKQAWDGLKALLLNYTPAGLVFKDWDKIKTWVTTMWPNLGGYAETAWNGLKTVLVNYTPHGLIFKHWDKIKAWATDMWPNLAVTADTAWTALKTTLAKYTPAGLIYTHWEGITKWFKELWASLPSIDWDAMINLEGIKAAWTAVTTWFSEAAAGFWDLMPDMPEWDFNLWGEEEQEDPKTLIAAAKAAEALEGKFPKITAAAQATLTAVNQVLAAIIASIAALDFTSEGARLVQSIATGMLSQLSTVQAAAAKIGSTIQNALPKGAQVAVNVTGAATVQGKRDAGGPVRAGFPYLVGERAPEIFVPGVSGSILPARVLQAAATASAVALPAAAQEVQFDTQAALARIDQRPPLSASMSAPNIKREGDTYHIAIHAAPGMDERAIARAVRLELARIQDERRGDLHDGVDY